MDLNKPEILSADARETGLRGGYSVLPENRYPVGAVVLSYEKRKRQVGGRWGAENVGRLIKLFEHQLIDTNFIDVKHQDCNQLII